MRVCLTNISNKTNTLSSVCAGRALPGEKTKSSSSLCLSVAVVYSAGVLTSLGSDSSTTWQHSFFNPQKARRWARYSGDSSLFWDLLPFSSIDLCSAGRFLFVNFSSCVLEPRAAQQRFSPAQNCEGLPSVTFRGESRALAWPETVRSGLTASSTPVPSPVPGFPIPQALFAVLHSSSQPQPLNSRVPLPRWRPSDELMPCVFSSVWSLLSSSEMLP